MSRIYKILLLLLTVWIYCACAAKKKKSSTASASSGSAKTTSSSSSNKKESTKTQKDIEKEAKSQADIQKKLEQLRDKINKNGVVSLSDDTFSKFVTDRPRDYHAVLMFTATDPMYKCSVCVRAKGVFEDLAKAYNLQYNFTTSSIENRIVFFRVEVDDARNVFGSLHLETVPRFYALPPTTKDSPKLKLESLEIESRSFLEGLPTAIKYISEVTKVKIQILNDPTLALLIGAFLSILLALFVTYGHRDLWGTFLFYQSPSLWVVISVICFGVGVSGSIFCIIRSAPPLGYGMRGDLAIFAPQGRDQYSVEGVIVALLTVGSGLSFFFMYLATKIRFPLVRHVLVIFFMTVFAVLCLEIWKAYTLKTMWYSLRETFPAEVWSWLTSSVKKNSGLAKRLVRVSEIWLTNTKDFATFYKKFEQLVIDYIKRIVFESAGTSST